MDFQPNLRKALLNAPCSITPCKDVEDNMEEDDLDMNGKKINPLEIRR